MPKPHQLHLDEEALRETLEEEARGKKERKEKIRQKQADDEEFFMEFGVVRYDSEYDLDVDDSNLHLTPVLRLSSSTRVEPSPSTSNPVRIIPGPAGIVQQAKPIGYCPNPVRIIPGPAGIVQQAKLLNKKVFILDSDGDLMSTHEYMQKIVEDVGEDDDFKSGSWEKLNQVVAIVKSCSLNMLGDLTVTMKDLPGTIPGTVHHKVIGESGYGKDITVGAALILDNFPAVAVVNALP
ncbi:zf-CCHC domain-containing protein [Tanacetum coccineum]